LGLGGTRAIPAADYVTPGAGGSYTLDDIVTLCGGITVSGSSGTYQLTGNLTIAPSDTLTLSAGQTLTASDLSTSVGIAFTVQGQLLVQGTSGTPVVLTCDSLKPGGWRGVQIDSASGPASSIDYAEISKARIGVHVRGAVSPTIQHSTFQDCLTAGIAVSPGSSAVIRFNTVSSSWDWCTGILLTGAAGAEVSTNTITAIPSGLYSAGSDAATLFADNETSAVLAGLVSAGSDASVIQDNIFSYGFLGGVATNEATSRWESNSVGPQATANMACAGSSRPVLRRNLFHDSGTLGGLVILDESLPDLGTDLEDGENVFQNHVEWDLLNFTSLNQLANGNTWSFSPPETGIYDYDEDTGDADGNGFQSGHVFLDGKAGVRDWMYF
jgi:hypothetical protein